jgi:hypothetical protein
LSQRDTRVSAGHELGDAFRAGRAHGVRVEPAFLPDQPGEELFWKTVAVGLGGDQRADAVDQPFARRQCMRWVGNRRRAESNEDQDEVRP